MGATEIMVQGTGMSMNQAFRDLQEQARNEFGSDEYNGTIYNIDEYKDKTNEWALSKLPVGDYLEGQYEEIEKREAVGVCIKPPIGAKPGVYMFAGLAPE